MSWGSPLPSRRNHSTVNTRCDTVRPTTQSPNPTRSNQSPNLRWSPARPSSKNATAASTLSRKLCTIASSAIASVYALSASSMESTRTMMSKLWGRASRLSRPSWRACSRAFRVMWMGSDSRRVTFRKESRTWPKLIITARGRYRRHSQNSSRRSPLNSRRYSGSATRPFRWPLRNMKKESKLLPGKLAILNSQLRVLLIFWGEMRYFCMLFSLLYLTSIPEKIKVSHNS